ncbi:MAG: hypothetical protein KGJ88_14000 [Verrucomicrobiota bacterium]|nr:hypothetical protein [Verrucomicrobiota bacterium]
MKNDGNEKFRTDSSQNLAAFEDKTVRFPKVIRHRKAVATIYGKSKNYPYYRLAYYTAGQRHVRHFSAYGHYFNLVRPNRGKEWQSPLQILTASAPALAGAVLNWVPLNLTQRHHFYLPKPNHQGHDVPSFP